MVVRKLCNLAVPGKTFAPVTRNRPFKGVVIRTATEKTAMVKVSHRIPQRIYGNFMRHNTLYMCHDEFELCNIGDEVMIQKSRPFSKRKHWKIHSWVRREPSALWFKIHPEYNITEEDKERLAQQVGFDYQFDQEAFEFVGKETFNIQEGLHEAEILPDRVKRTLSDQLINATLMHRATSDPPEVKFEKAKKALNLVIEAAQRERERHGLPTTWALDDEPGEVTIARMEFRKAQNAYEAHLNNLRAIHDRKSAAFKKGRGVPEDEPAYPELARFVAAKDY